MSDIYQQLDNIEPLACDQITTLLQLLQTRIVLLASDKVRMEGREKITTEDVKHVQQHAFVWANEESRKPPVYDYVMVGKFLDDKVVIAENLNKTKQIP